MTGDISIIVGDQTVSGWTRVRVTRGIERMPSDFEIEMTEFYSGDNSTVVISPGAPCQVFLMGKPVLKGYVDEYDVTIKGDTHRISIYGRSMSEDLVDCSAEWPNAQILSSTIINIVKGLATTPYGIPVTQTVIPDTTKNHIPQLTFIYGETAAEIISRICRYAKLLFYDMPDGSIVLTTASSKKAACGFTEGVNVQEATATFTMNRFQQYICEFNSVVQYSDLTQQNSGQNNSVNQIGTPQVDSTVLRNRKKYIILESGDFAPFPVTTSRALWEKNRRFGKAWEVRITTDSWVDSAGNLWEPNTLVDLALPTLKIPKATWLISEVTFARDNEKGTTATLLINPPEAFIPEPIVLIPSRYPDVPGNNGSSATSQGTTISGVQTVNYPAYSDPTNLVAAPGVLNVPTSGVTPVNASGLTPP